MIDIREIAKNPYYGNLLIKYVVRDIPVMLCKCGYVRHVQDYHGMNGVYRYHTFCQHCMTNEDGVILARDKPSNWHRHYKLDDLMSMPVPRREIKSVTWADLADLVERSTPKETL